MTDSENVSEPARFPAGEPRAPRGTEDTTSPSDTGIRDARGQPAALDPIESSARHWLHPHLSAAELVGLLTSATIGIGYLLAPLMGGDLSAQLARADFATAFPLTPVDLQWFGGFLPFGYSIWVPWVMGIMGVRLTGVLATILATWLTARLFVRTGARRATWGAAAAAITLGSNLIEGRVTFACGIA